MKWAFFYERQYNTPDRGDYYTMQVAMQIDRLIDTIVSLFKNLGSRQYRLQKYLIQFGVSESNTETMTVQREEEIVVVNDDKPGVLIPSYSDPSELDQERIKQATQNSMANWGLWLGAALENKRRLAMRNKGDAGYTGSGA